MIIKSKGHARIKGSRVRVVDIVRKYYILRYSKREIAEQHHLTIDEINEALWYFITHRREILETLREEEMITIELLRLRFGLKP